ncbi:hypothetical protein AB0I72_19995 [Nocardiopsis sp. NPDC049922]|uniref:hypothetical protein n=1 Tax=Nocardiopsis sp. NPDC049922 TaxID=3155157 RepID=UPI0033F333BE
MRIRVTEPVTIKVKGGKKVGLDAHHEYYLDDDKTAADLVRQGKAVELDGRGREVKRSVRQAAKTKEPGGTPGKPATDRTTKAATEGQGKKDG